MTHHVPRLRHPWTALRVTKLPRPSGNIERELNEHPSVEKEYACTSTHATEIRPLQPEVAMDARRKECIVQRALKPGATTPQTKTVQLNQAKLNHESLMYTTFVIQTTHHSQVEYLSQHLRQTNR